MNITSSSVQSECLLLEAVAILHVNTTIQLTLLTARSNSPRPVQAVRSTVPLKSLARMIKLDNGLSGWVQNRPAKGPERRLKDA